MKNNFFYYRNYPNNYVMIHKGNCRFCNGGIGIQNNILGDANGLWSNPFYTYREALDEATETALLMPGNNTLVKDCSKCNPAQII